MHLYTPQLQKSAVLQKTIDHIRHQENTIKRLQEENARLREALSKGVCVWGVCLVYQARLSLTLLKGERVREGLA